MKQYFVYIVECADGLLYTGINNNPDRRIKEHNAGDNKNSFTYKRRPVKMIFLQEFNGAEQAIYFEKKIKNWSSKKKKALATGDYEILPLVAECKNLTNSKYYRKDVD